MTESKFPLDSDGKVPLILLVDDQEINRILLENQLCLIGLRSESADSGNAALEKIKNTKFALVITDCQMPGMDGYALAREIRRIESEQNSSPMPVIAWSANDIREETKVCRAAGMSDVLGKPATPEQLARILKKYLLPAVNHSAKSASAQHRPVTNQLVVPLDYAILQKNVPDYPEQQHVLRNFYQHLHIDYDKLIPSIIKLEYLDIETRVHRMKGACELIGATLMVDVLGRLEFASRQHDTVGINQTRIALIKAYDQLTGYFIQIGIIENQVELQNKE